MIQGRERCAGPRQEPGLQELLELPQVGAIAAHRLGRRLDVVLQVQDEVADQIHAAVILLPLDGQAAAWVPAVPKTGMDRPHRSLLLRLQDGFELTVVSQPQLFEACSLSPGESAATDAPGSVKDGSATLAAGFKPGSIRLPHRFAAPLFFAGALTRFLA